MKEVNNLLRELSLEKGRWDCPNYYCVVLTSKANWEILKEYVNKWVSIEDVLTRNYITLPAGGRIYFYPLGEKSAESMMTDFGGREITTSILDSSVVSIFKYPLKNFPLYLMSRMRSSSKYYPRLVII